MSRQQKAHADVHYGMKGEEMVVAAVETYSLEVPAPFQRPCRVQSMNHN